MRSNMRVERADRTSAKGWYAGPWDGDLSIPIGYANAGIDEPHVHTEMFEIYFVARGSSVIRVEQKNIKLPMGDVIIVEPGEAHTFLESSDDYHHFVICAPRKGRELPEGDKLLVERRVLGL